MPTHRVMTPQDGDKLFEFDTKNDIAVKEAMERFNDLVQNQKMWAALVDDNGKTLSLLKAFDPEANVVFSRQLQGG